MRLPVRVEQGDPVRIAVDDDPRVVKAPVRFLARIVPGADCRSAHDSFSTSALLASFRPELVVLDVVMPGMSGLEACEHIRSTPALAGTVIASGHPADEFRDRLAEAGADRCITKPFDDDLARAVVDLLPPARAAAGGEA
jgi:DNA-binding response OmpR family regulator